MGPRFLQGHDHASPTGLDEAEARIRRRSSSADALLFAALLGDWAGGVPRSDVHWAMWKVEAFLKWKGAYGGLLPWASDPHPPELTEACLRAFNAVCLREAVALGFRNLLGLVDD